MDYINIFHNQIIALNLFLILIKYAASTSILAASNPEGFPCEPPSKIEHGSVHVRTHHRDKDILGQLEEKTLPSSRSTQSIVNNFLPSEELKLLLPAHSRLLYPEGSVSEYMCEHGFWIPPPLSSERTCLEGEWLGDIPYCVPKGCLHPENLLNGYYLELSESSQNLYPPGARLQFLCHSGYLLKGSDMFTCDDNDSWNPIDEPQCLPSPQILKTEKCPLPPDVFGSTQKLIQGVVDVGGAVNGTEIEYRCRSGYRNVIDPCVSHLFICSEGQWHGTSPKCEEFTTCVAPPNIANGFLYREASSYPLNSEVYYSCERNYLLLGPTVLTCGDDGCWKPSMAPVCQLNHSNMDNRERRPFSIHTLLIASISGIIAVLFLLLVLLLYHRAVSPKLMRLRNSSSGTDLDPQVPANCSSAVNGQLQPDNDPDRVALIAFHDELMSTSHGVPPTYEEAVRQRPPINLDYQYGGRSAIPHTHRSRGHRVVVPGVRRSRHRDHPDNISYQSIGSARQSSSTSRSMSIRSSSACDSLGSTDTVAISDSTNVTIDTMSSGASSAASQTASCRALAGSRASFDTCSLITNEGAPLLEEVEGEIDDLRAVDQYSLSTRDSDSLKDNVSHTRSVTLSLQE